MADADLYDTDILAWSEQQAHALRELATRRDLPNALDLAHVVEEIEDVGQSQLNAVKSFIRLILVHALKCVFVPNSTSLRHWHAEIGNWQSELVDRVTHSMRHKIEMDVLWVRAVKQAKLDLFAQAGDMRAVIATLEAQGKICPVSLDDLLPEAGSPTDVVALAAKNLESMNA